MVAATAKSTAQAVGTAEFDVPDKQGKLHRVTLENACYSPSQPFNLVSVSAILGQTASNPRRIAESPDFDKRLELTLASRRKPVIPMKLENGMYSVVAHACAHTRDPHSGPNMPAALRRAPLAAAARTRGAQRGLAVPAVGRTAHKVVTPVAITPTRGTVDWQLSRKEYALHRMTCSTGAPRVDLFTCGGGVAHGNSQEEDSCSPGAKDCFRDGYSWIGRDFYGNPPCLHKFIMEMLLKAAHDFMLSPDTTSFLFILPDIPSAPW